MEEMLSSRYVLLLIRRWKWLAGSAGTAALVATLVVAAQPAAYAATVDVVPKRARTEVNYDTRIKSVSSESSGQASGSQAPAALAGMSPERRQALARLVRNADVERAVRDALGETLPAPLRVPGQLMHLVAGKVVPRSEVITITTSAPSAALAEQIAAAWARAYERQVNQLYATNAAGTLALDAEVTETQQKYQSAEDALIGFGAATKLGEHTRQLEMKQQLLKEIRGAQQALIAEVAKKETEAKMRSLSELLGARSANLTAAQRKEQETKTKLFEAYVDAQTQATLAVFTQQAQAKVQSLSDLYKVAQRVDLLAGDAEALRQHLANAGDDGAAASNHVALTLLKAQAFASSTPLPATLQIQLPSGPTPATVVQQRADVDATRRALREWQGRLRQEIQSRSTELLSGQGYTLDAAAPDSPLFRAIRQRHEALFRSGDLAKLSEGVSLDEAQETFLKRMKEALEFSVALRMADDPPDSALSQSAAQMEEEIRALQTKVAEESVRQKNLQLARDLTWESYTSLVKKAEEARVSGLVGAGNEVTVASQSVVAERQSKRLSVIALLAGLLGMLVSAGWFLAQDMVPDVRRRIEAAGSAVAQDGGHAANGFVPPAKARAELVEEPAG